MKRKLVGLGLLVSISGCCAISSEKMRELEARINSADCKGFVSGFEGLQPWSGNLARDLTQDIAESCRMANITTNNGTYMEHLLLIKKAYQQGKNITLLGYSLGAQDAVELARECNKENIPVNLVLLDWAVHRSIPKNVKTLVYIEGGVPYAFRDKKPLKQDLENPETEIEYLFFPNSCHLQLPVDAKERLKETVKKLNGVSLYFNGRGYSQDYRFAQESGKGKDSPEVFQDRQGRVWGGRHFSWDNSSKTKKNSQRVLAFRKFGNSRAFV